MGQPLSSVSGRKRYNTLDFASKIVCQQGCFSPLLETQSQGMRLACRLGQCFKMLRILRSPPETRPPSGHPHIFLENGTQTVKMQFATIPRKIQKKAEAPIVSSIKLPFNAENSNSRIWIFEFLHESTMCGFYWNVIMFDGLL